MAMVATFRRADGTVERELPDPVGGTFDAVGDFDALLDSPVFPLLGGIDPYGFTALRSRCLRCLRMSVPPPSTPQLATARPASTVSDGRACLVEPAFALHFEGD